MATVHFPISAFVKLFDGWPGVCGLLILLGGGMMGPLSAAQAASVSSKLNVSVRVVRGCRIHATPTNFDRFDLPASPRQVRTASRTGLTLDCGTDSEGVGTMALTTESSNAGTPIIDVYSNGAPVHQAQEPHRVTYKKTDLDAEIIRWGLFPVDAQLNFSIPEHESAGQLALTESRERTLKIIIDF